MKKIALFCSTLTALFLAACSPASPVSIEKDATHTATFQVTVDGKTSQKQVVFEAGDSVMDVLDDHYAVEDEAGMVTVIDGVRQNPTTNTYWMYKLNGQMASKGAEDQILADGDTVEFYLESFE